MEAKKKKKGKGKKKSSKESKDKTEKKEDKIIIPDYGWLNIEVFFLSINNNDLIIK